MSAHVPASAGNDWRNGMEPIPDWADQTIVYVDGRLSRNRARMEVCRNNDDRWGIFYRDTNARHVYMRTVLVGRRLRRRTARWTAARSSAIGTTRARCRCGA
jgi:hypothetical protein